MKPRLPGAVAEVWDLVLALVGIPLPIRGRGCRHHHKRLQ